MAVMICLELHKDKNISWIGIRIDDGDDGEGRLNSDGKKTAFLLPKSSPNRVINNPVLKNNLSQSIKFRISKFEQRCDSHKDEAIFQRVFFFFG